MSYFELDVSQCDAILKTIEEFSDGSEAESIVNEYLGGEGGDLIKEGMQNLLRYKGEPGKERKEQQSRRIRSKRRKGTYL